jgi:hypothetical protein
MLGGVEQGPASPAMAKIRADRPGVSPFSDPGSGRPRRGCRGPRRFAAACAEDWEVPGRTRKHWHQKTRRRTGGLELMRKWLAEHQANALGIAALSSTACG